MKTMLDKLIDAVRQHTPMDLPIDKIKPKPMTEEEQKIDTNNFFKVNCPVVKVNFKPETPQIVLGAYMVECDHEDMVEKIKEKADLENLNDHTMLIFNDRHKTELSLILYGISIGVELMDPYKEIEIFFNKCAVSGITYGEYKDRCKDLGTDYTEKLMTILPFITYKDIDDLCGEAIEYLSKKADEVNGRDTDSGSNS